MTAPQQPPQDPTAAQVTAAVAVLTFALAALEQKVRGDVAAAIATVIGAWFTVVAAAIATATFSSGTELLSRPDVHRGLQRALAAGRTSVTATIRSGYTAAAAIGWAHARTEVVEIGHELPTGVPELGDTIADLLGDMTTAFANAQPDAQNHVRDAFDGILAGDHPTPARLLVVHQAITRFAATLQRRAQAAGAVAVHRGASDAQLRAYEDIGPTNPYIRVRKQWVVTSANPCGMCAALDGTVIALDAEFDHQATTGVDRLRGVWGDLLSPPRHPNCRCRLELVTTP